MDCRQTAVTKTEHTYGNRGLSLESPSFTASSHFWVTPVHGHWWPTKIYGGKTMDLVHRGLKMKG